MKRAFPEWLRRLDPMLNAEDSNAVFEAFRRRRKVHARGRFLTSLKYSFAGASVQQLALYGVVIVASVVAFAFLGCCAIPIVAVALTIIGRSFQRGRVQKGVMPRRLEQVFSVSGFMETQAIDLWLSGATGRDVLEALYLERRERNWLATILVMVLLGMVAVGIYLYLAKPWHIVGAMVVLSIVWITYELTWMLLVGGMGTLHENVLKNRVVSWGSASLVADTVLEILKRLGWIVVAFVVIGLVGGLVAFVATTIAAHEGGTGEYRDEFVAISILVVLALVLHFIRIPLRNRYLAALLKLMDEGNYAFDRFMAGVVVDDPEGAAWANWRHNVRKPEARGPG